MITEIRLMSQQLQNQRFNDPKKLISWMGAVQAQDYRMMKWAVGVRLKSANLRAVEESFRKGEILRTHVMRPTWHLVAAEDLRWMLKLSSQRIKAAWNGYAKRYIDVSEGLYTRSNDLFEKVLQGNNHLTKQELGEELAKVGIMSDPSGAGYLIAQAEQDSILCSGVDKGGKATYALLEERAPKGPELHKEEALSMLALRYFRSHSPATLNDFVWWSGLSVTEARQAIGLIDAELVVDQSASGLFYIHQTWKQKHTDEDVFHFLPPFDEYLISYKDRATVIDPKHQAKAYNNFGTFYPVVLHNGNIIGNWSISTKKKERIIDTTFFEKSMAVDKELIEAAEKRYKVFMEK